MFRLRPKINLVIVLFAVISFLSQMVQAIDHCRFHSVQITSGAQILPNNPEVEKRSGCLESHGPKSNIESVVSQSDQNNDTTPDHSCGDCSHLHCSFSFLDNVNEVAFCEIDQTLQFSAFNLNFHNNFQNSIYRPPIA